MCYNVSMYKTINIDDELHRRIKVFCVTQNITMSQFIQDAVEEGLSKIPAEKIISEKRLDDTLSRIVGESVPKFKSFPKKKYV